MGGLGITDDSGPQKRDTTAQIELFNASLDAGTRRANSLHEGDALDENAFVDLVREAVASHRS